MGGWMDGEGERERENSGKELSKWDMNRRGRGGCTELTKGVFGRVCAIEEPVFVLVVFVDRRHERGCGRDGSVVVCAVDKDEERLFGRELDPLADDVGELAHSEVGRDKVLFLVDLRNVPRVLCLLANHRNTVLVLAPDPSSLGLPLLKRVVCFKRSCRHCSFFREMWLPC